MAAITIVSVRLRLLLLLCFFPFEHDTNRAYLSFSLPSIFILSLCPFAVCSLVSDRKRKINDEGQYPGYTHRAAHVGIDWTLLLRIHQHTLEPTRPRTPARIHVHERPPTFPGDVEGRQSRSIGKSIDSTRLSFTLRSIWLLP